jgi:hypothetical protein
VTLRPNAARQGFRPPTVNLCLKHQLLQEYLVFELLKLDIVPRWLP